MKALNVAEVLFVLHDMLLERNQTYLFRNNHAPYMYVYVYRGLIYGRQTKDGFPFWESLRVVQELGCCSSLSAEIPG